MLRRPALRTRFARLMCWVLLLLPLMQTAAVAHELGHLNEFAVTKTVTVQENGSPLAHNGVCDACIAFATIASGIASTHAGYAVPPQEHSVWQAVPPPHFAARSFKAYASRAPPRILA